MCENQGELLSLRPSLPTFWLLRRSPINRPRVREPPPPVLSSPSPKSRAKPPGQKGFEDVITVSYPHNAKHGIAGRLRPRQFAMLAIDSQPSDFTQFISAGERTGCRSRAGRSNETKTAPFMPA